MCWAPVSQQNFSCNVTYLFCVLVGFFYPVDVVVGFSLGAPENWTPPSLRYSFLQQEAVPGVHCQWLLALGVILFLVVEEMSASTAFCVCIQ